MISPEKWNAILTKNSEGLGYSGDVWAMGCLLHFMHYGEWPGLSRMVNSYFEFCLSIKMECPRKRLKQKQLHTARKLHPTLLK